MVCVKIKNTHKLHSVCQITHFVLNYTLSVKAANSVNYYTVKCQFFAFNLEKITPGRKNLHRHRLWCLWQIWGMGDPYRFRSFFGPFYSYFSKVLGLWPKIHTTDQGDPLTLFDFENIIFDSKHSCLSASIHFFLSIFIAYCLKYYCTVF